MARRRYFRPQENFYRGPRINDHIRKTPIRLINENDEMVGVVPTPEALRLSREAGLDLVEVAPDSDPPVCRIMDFGKWKYEQSKKDKANKARSKNAELKEVRLGRSMKIDPHDVKIRMNQARRFLMDGHKVQIVQNFRGREMVHRDRGIQRMNEIIEQLTDVGKLDVPPRMTGRRMTMIIGPDKAKIERIKQRSSSKQDQSRPGDEQADGRTPGGGDAAADGAASGDGAAAANSEDQAQRTVPDEQVQSTSARQ